MEVLIAILLVAVALGALCAALFILELLLEVLYRISPSFREWCDREAEKFLAEKDDEYAE